MSTATMGVTAEAIAGLLEGRCKASRTDAVFAQVARQGGAFVISCGWVVPEADEDDYMTFPPGPFQHPRHCPWVGRTITTSDPAEAAELYAAYKDAVYSRQAPARGQKIGSVTR